MKKILSAASACCNFLDEFTMQVFATVVFFGLLFAAMPAVMHKLSTSKDVVHHYQVKNNEKTNPCGENGTPLLMNAEYVQCVTKRGHRTGKPIPITLASAE